MAPGERLLLLWGMSRKPNKRTCAEPPSTHSLRLGDSGDCVSLPFGRDRQIKLWADMPLGRRPNPVARPQVLDLASTRKAEPPRSSAPLAPNGSTVERPAHQGAADRRTASGGKTRARRGRRASAGASLLPMPAPAYPIPGGSHVGRRREERAASPNWRIARPIPSTTLGLPQLESKVNDVASRLIFAVLA